MRQLRKNLPDIPKELKLAVPNKIKLMPPAVPYRPARQSLPAEAINDNGLLIVGLRDIANEADLWVFMNGLLLFSPGDYQAEVNNIIRFEERSRRGDIFQVRFTIGNEMHHYIIGVT